MSASELTAYPNRGIAYRPLHQLRTVIQRGLQDLCADRTTLTWMLGRSDVPEQGPSASTWSDEAARAVMELLLNREHPLRVQFGYPKEHTSLPVIALLPSGGGDDEAARGMRDWDAISIPVAGKEDPVTGAKSVRQANVLRYPWTTTVQISTWVPAPELALLVHDLVIDVIRLNEGLLAPAGVREAPSIREREVMQPKWERAQVSLVPSFDLTLRWERVALLNRYPMPTEAALSGTTVTNP